MSDFNIILPLQKDVNCNELTGIASTTSIDRDDERMSPEALKSMVQDFKTQGINLFQNHSHGWEDTLGFIKDAEIIDNKVQVKIELDDATTNPKIPMLLNKLKKGIKLGLSVGGNVSDFSWQYDKQLGKKIKVMDKVKLYELSVVGIPSNADSYMSLSQAISKSAKIQAGASKCPLCYSEMKKQCDMCFYEED